MRLRDLTDIINVIEKMKKPSNPIARRKVFSLLRELKDEKEIQDVLAKSYITEQVVMIEQKKKSRISVTLTDSIKTELHILENNPEYLLAKEFVRYQESKFTPKTDLLNIDEVDDNVFDGLTSEEITHLMSIIK